MDKLILFDMDGTLVDSVDTIVDICNELADEHGYPTRITREEIRSYSSEQLVRHFGVPFWRIFGFLKEARKRISERIVELKVHPGLRPVLESLRGRAILGVVSSSDEQQIRAVLDQDGISNLFSFVAAGSIFGKNKQIKRACKDLGIIPSDTLYVGDETRDVHAARRAKVDSLAVVWGMQSEEVLAKTRPTMLARSPEELEQLATAWLDSAF